MVGRYLFMIVVAVFSLGILVGNMFSGVQNSLEQPLSTNLITGRSFEKSSPSDHISEDKIHVFKDRVVIDLKNSFWASFTDTNSMDPIIDAGANSIEIKPKSPDEIHVGDIISFSTVLAEGSIIHRVISKGQDEEGAYYHTKGDNNPRQDPGKVRFEDINGVVVAVIY